MRVKTSMLKSLIMEALNEVYDPEQHTSINDPGIEDFTLGHKVGDSVKLEGTAYGAVLAFQGSSKQRIKWNINEAVTEEGRLKGRRFIVAEFNPDDWMGSNSKTVKGQRSIFIMNGATNQTVHNFEGDVYDAMAHVRLRRFKS